jgi:N-acetylglucosamine kinase-like BadF-type ATPase
MCFVRLPMQVRQYVEQMDGVERALAKEREGAARLSATLESTVKEVSAALDAAAGRGSVLRAELEQQTAVLDDAGRQVARLQKVSQLQSTFHIIPKP